MAGRQEPEVGQTDHGGRLPGPEGLQDTEVGHVGRQPLWVNLGRWTVGAQLSQTQGSGGGAPPPS